MDHSYLISPFLATRLRSSVVNGIVGKSEEPFRNYRTNCAMSLPQSKDGPRTTEMAVGRLSDCRMGRTILGKPLLLRGHEAPAERALVCRKAGLVRSAWVRPVAVTPALGMPGSTADRESRASRAKRPMHGCSYLQKQTLS